jgi:glutamyl-tRNA synthetase
MENITKIVKIAREPAETLSDIPTHAKVYFADEFELPKVSEEMSEKEKKHIEKMYATLQSETAKKAIELFVTKINSCSEEIAEESAKEILTSVMEEIGEGPGKVLMPLRLVLTGESKGPDLYTIIHIIGKTRVLKRVENTVKKI